MGKAHTHLLAASLFTFISCPHLSLFSQSTGTGQNWLADVQQHIAQQEYHIGCNEATGLLGSPNRAQNLRVFYAPDYVEMVTRVDSLGQEDWRLRLEVLGIERDGMHVPAHPSGREYVDGCRVVFDHGAYQVEYLNGPAGMRQNFYLQKPVGPMPTTMRVNMAVSGGLQAEQVHDAEVYFGQCNDLGALDKKISYNSLKAWDATGRSLDAKMEVTQSGTELALVVSTVGAVFPVTVDPICTPYSLMIESGQSYSNLGVSVSGAGDVNGDGYDDVIVGAERFDNGQSEEGAAFVYYGSALGITTNAPSHLEGNQTLGLFGNVVSDVGDVNGDGYDDVILAAKYYQGGLATGYALLYEGSASGIAISTPDTLVQFPYSNYLIDFNVSGAGDVNGDGFDDVIVGAAWYPDPYLDLDSGAALIYHGSASGISTTFTTKLSGPYLHSYFGASVSGAGDVNGDGYDDVIVGAIGFDNSHVGEGAAFVYHGSPAGVSTIASAPLECNQYYARLGNSVSDAGDINGDGYGDVIVGARGYSNSSIREGAAFVFQGGPSGVSTAYSAMLLCHEANAALGYSVSGAGDLNGDGYSDVIVGAPYITIGNGGVIGYGAAYIYHGSALGFQGLYSARLEDNDFASRFGYSVSGAGDVNGDGYSDVIVGAPRYYNGQEEEGAATIHHGGIWGVSNSAPPTFTQNGITLTANQTWSSYQWYRNSYAIPGANASSFTLTGSGAYTYYLQVTDSNGCSRVSEGSLITRMDDALGMRLGIYPNPARGEFKLRTEIPIRSVVTVNVTDIYGKRIASHTLPELTAEAAFDIHLLPAGTYFVEVVAEEGMRRSLRLVVQ